MPSEFFRVATRATLMLSIGCVAACSGGSFVAPKTTYATSTSTSEAATAAPAPISTSSSTSSSMPIPTPSASPTPDVVTTNSAYDPPAGTYPYFSSSIFLAQLSHPTPNPSSSAWLSKIAPVGLTSFQFAANASGTASDYGYPIYMAANTGSAYKIHCTVNYGKPCSIEGKEINILSSMIPENGTPTGCNGDCHMGFIANGYEYDFFGTQWPPSGNTIDIAHGGECPLGGPGYGTCAATATGTALSLGILRPTDWVAAAKDGGTLPYALQVAVKCTDSVVAPFTNSDGTCAGGVPEGSRAYLAMHDSDVNATPGLTPLATALLRSIDEDHYGMIVTDTNGGEAGFQIATENDLTYTALGLPGPWVSEFVPEAEAEGLNVSTDDNVDYVTIPYGGIDFGSTIQFI